MDTGKYNWKNFIVEIFVVFLGISAGFLLNSWWMQRQEDKLEEKYILGFLADASDNIKELETAVATDSVWLARANSFLTAIQDGHLKIDSARIAAGLILNFSKIEPHNGTYANLISSGNFNIIGNFELRTDIVNYHMAINGVEFLEDYFYKYHSDFVMPFIYAEYNLLTRKFDNPEIINTIRFTNVFTGYYSMIQQRKSAYNDLLDKTYLFKEALQND